MSICRCIALALLMFLPHAALASQITLDEALQQLQTKRDLAGIRAHLTEASEEQLASASGLRWQAWLALADKDRERAMALIEQGIKSHPDDPDLILMQAGQRLNGLSASGGLSALRAARQSSGDFQRAVELDPQHAGARTALIQYYLNAPRIAGGGAGRAEPHLQALKVRHPESYQALRVQQALAGGDSKRANELIDQLLQMDLSHDTRQLAALVLQQAERWDDAWQQLEMVTTAVPTHGGAWYQIGRTAILGEQRFEQGIAAFERFLALPMWPGDPTHAHGWWRLGMLHELNGQPDAARSAYQNALREDPELEEAKEALAAMK